MFYNDNDLTASEDDSGQHINEAHKAVDYEACNSLLVTMTRPKQIFFSTEATSIHQIIQIATTPTLKTTRKPTMVRNNKYINDKYIGRMGNLIGDLKDLE